MENNIQSSARSVAPLRHASLLSSPAVKKKKVRDRKRFVLTLMYCVMEEVHGWWCAVGMGAG